MSALALVCIPLALVAAILLWLFIAQRRELQDLEQLSQQLQRIAIGGSLAGRVEAGSSKPELSALVTAINHLLTRAASDREGSRVTPKLFAELGERIHEAVLVHREVILYANRQF
ncbi:MAG: HAMP domain-containing protein, partial [Steroidobacteraceae bacterium]